MSDPVQRLKNFNIIASFIDDNCVPDDQGNKRMEFSKFVTRIKGNTIYMYKLYGKKYLADLAPLVQFSEKNGEIPLLPTQFLPAAVGGMSDVSDDENSMMAMSYLAGAIEERPESFEFTKR